MNKKNKILSCIQILAILSIIVCNGSITVNTPQKYREFPCKGHQCGCKSEPDHERNCCCTFTGKQGMFLTGNKQKDVFQVFVSSINCKYGNDPLTGIIFTGKYILEEQVRPIKIPFLCFLPLATSIYLPEAFVSPPKKPPRFFV